ncbi:MAG: nitrous oxide reductase family maturation protein NosD [Gammaproteobacteria bacterium]|nr:nitrous oxide reductase family maturation protein NosD [Gammaproteobacteria bacterium]
MKYSRKLFFISLLGCYSTSLTAVEYRLTASKSKPQQIINAAKNGDKIIFSPGLYAGQLQINKSLILQGEQGAILDGQFKNDVIRVTAPNVIIRGLTIKNSGHNLTKMNAGIFVEKSAINILIENNQFDGNTFGIYLWRTSGSKILNNKVHGTPDRRSQDRGNGIHLSLVKKATIKGNEIWQTRDGVYIESSNNNIIDANTMYDLRYGVHYMYSHSNKVINNKTRNTRTGYALMQSTRLTVQNNSSEQDRNYGILLNFITYSDISNNRINNVREGGAFVTGGARILGAEGKAIFIYNSQYNEIKSNLFANCDIGIHLTAGSEDNKIYGNAFARNRVQVKYVSNRPQDWSKEGQGNFWSDYLGWDLNADGIGDKDYEPNDAVDKLLWKFPIARMLMNSPAVQTLRWVQTQFPVLKPQGVRDSAPLMLSPQMLRTDS